MAPRPLTSIFMAPPPPSRLTASGGQAGSGPTTPTYNAAFPGMPVTALPEGGISILVPTTAEPEKEPEPEAPVWMPKARQGLGIGAVGKSSVWDGMAPIPDSTAPVGNRASSSKITNPAKARSQTAETSATNDTDALSDSSAMPKKRHIPRSPLDPHRLALISNALGVSMPIPPRSVLQVKVPEERVRKASLDDARLAHNHARTTSLASFRSARASPTPAHLRGTSSLSTRSQRPLPSASSSVSTFSFTTPSQPTRYLLHVYPPPHMPSIHPFASLSPPPGYHSQFRRGTLIALHASLPGQLSAIAKEYGLPSTNGMCVYLLSADYEPPESDEEEPVKRDERSLGPRISEEPWKMLWASLLKADRDELMRSYNPNEASITSSPASGLTALAGEDSPPPNQQTLSHKASTGSFSPRPLRTVASVNSREGFKGIGVGAASGPGQTPLSATSPASSTPLSRNPSLATTQSRTSSPTTTLSTNPTTTISIMPALPIVGKIEFDIDMRRAPWYETFCNRANQQLSQRRLPSRVNTPVGPMATPAPRSSGSDEVRAPSPITLTLPPRARSVSPSADGSTALFPRAASPSSPSKFPMHLQLPANPANRNDRGLLSPKDAMATPTSPGAASGWPTDDETAASGLGLQLSPSSSTVADGMLPNVVAEGGYAALGDEEDGTSDMDTSSMLRPGADPLGDVFPEEPWNASTRAMIGIEDLPRSRNEGAEDDDEMPPIDPAEEVEDVKKLWNENNRPSIELPEPLPVVRPTGPSPVIFPRPAPARQRSDSNKRPPPLKLGSTDDAETKESEGAKDDARSLMANSIIVTGEDGEEDWTWRSSEHIRKERLDELEKALAQLSPRILEPPPPEFDRPRSPGLHHRMLSGGNRTNGARPDPHAPLFMSEELSNLRASMAAKNGTRTPNSAQASPSWPAVPFAQPSQGSSPNLTPGGTPMTSEHRIRMQTEQMRLDMANLPPPGTAPPRPRRPQTPVALNSPPLEDSPPVPSHQRSRFSMDSNGGDDIMGLSVANRERTNSIMSVKGIKKLWRGRNSTQNLNGKVTDAPPPVPGSPNPQGLALNGDNQVPPPTPPSATLSLTPGTHRRQSSQAQSAQVAAVKSGTHKRDSSNSGKDPFHFDQDSRYPVRSRSPSYLSDLYPPVAPPNSAATAKDKDKEKEKATTKSILKKWGSKTKKAEGESESAPGTRPESRLAPNKALNGVGGPTHSAQGSVSSVNTLTGAQSNSLQADLPSRPSVSSSLTSDAEPMTPRMSQFEMVVPAQNQ